MTSVTRSQILLFVPNIIGIPVYVSHCHTGRVHKHTQHFTCTHTHTHTHTPAQLQPRNTPPTQVHLLPSSSFSYCFICFSDHHLVCCVYHDMHCVFLLSPTRVSSCPFCLPSSLSFVLSLSLSLSLTHSLSLSLCFF